MTVDGGVSKLSFKAWSGNELYFRVILDIHSSCSGVCFYSAFGFQAHFPLMQSISFALHVLHRQIIKTILEANRGLKGQNLYVSFYFSRKTMY